MCFFIKLGRHFNHGERMNSIDFGGHRSKVKVTMGIVDKCGVRGDAMFCGVIFDFWSQLAVSMEPGKLTFGIVNVLCIHDMVKFVHKRSSIPNALQTVKCGVITINPKMN